LKKIFVVILFFMFPYFLFSIETVKIKDIRTKIDNLSKEETSLFIEQIINKKVEKETGWIIIIKNHDATNDVVLIELDKPKINNMVPDLFFIINKKISKRLSELQMIYFKAVINNYDFDSKLIEVTDVYLSGIMR
jgi:hypothetical protein